MSDFLSFGFHIQISDFLQHIADAVQLRHAFRHVAQRSERGGEIGEQAQVFYTPRGMRDDVVKSHCEGRERGVQERPVAVRGLDVGGETGDGAREVSGEPERVAGGL